MPTLEEQCPQETLWQATGSGRTSLLDFQGRFAKSGAGSSKAAHQ